MTLRLCIEGGSTIIQAPQEFQAAMCSGEEVHWGPAIGVAPPRCDSI